MLDFLLVSKRTSKKGKTEIYPKFLIKMSSDLMIRGGDFYAIWDENSNTWSTDEYEAFKLIDEELDNYYEEHKDELDIKNTKVLHIWDSNSGMVDNWHKYCQRQMRDSFHKLDEKLIFSDQEITKKDYATKKLPYPLKPCDITNYETLMNTLYSPEEREKIEWAIGSVINGDSKKLQKFIVLYGSAGTGKSTVLNIIQKLFEGYYSVFDAKALGSSNSNFALEAFRTNPLVAIQHDGDLSKIEDNTKLNSLVSHELMTVNEKFKSTYTSNFDSFLFMGTNKPVRITDSKSGLMRRLIDVQPTGNTLSISDYKKLTKAVNFELGGIACHCKNVYESDPDKYETYSPKIMIDITNDFYNFVSDSYFTFKDEDGTTLKAAWEMYKRFCEDANIQHPMNQRIFKEELKSYFNKYEDRKSLKDGQRVRSYYSGFISDKFMDSSKSVKKNIIKKYEIEFKEQESIFDKECSGMLAQYANDKETPSYKWEGVKTKLADIKTSKLHYVKVPENHIVIDFDIPDENGEKCYEKNLEEANKWPKTYAELSKSGKGIHLHYIYDGDVSKLSRVYDENIEVKIFNGNSSLRRKLTKCNDVPIATINSGLPLKEDSKVINNKAIKDEKHLRIIIKKCLNKEVHPNTKPNVDFIYKLLNDAYDNKVKYDVTDMRNYILTFAAGSTHQSDYCIELVGKMKFKSEEPSDNWKSKVDKIVFYDVEVFPNLFLINYKIEGEKNPVVRMINPTPQEVEQLMDYKLVGFNCRRYDNHILYARLMGYTNEELFNLSQKIVSGNNNALFGEAYNISYTDIYDFSTKKQSLKKWEIELGIHHQELGLPWDQPVEESMWDKVAEYCDNDVIATEAVWNACQADFIARQIQVDLVKNLHDISNVTVNDTTNSLSTKIIFGKNKTPQSVFNYRDLSKPVSYKKYSKVMETFGPDYKCRIFDKEGLPTYKTYNGTDELPDGYSILPFFPGYKFDAGKSTYLGEEIGEGGKVYSEPGMYVDIWDGDVASMHPHSIIFESLFGPEYTKRFADIVEARVAIKHKDFERAGSLLDGVLKPYLKEDLAPALADALKIVINSIYGLTSARFANPFRDERNIDNIVAKRGALFMTLLKQEVQKQGFQVAHIKTDSIKIPKATKAIQDFVIKFGKEYGYSFETEAEYERFCIVNDAVYVARDTNKNWTAVGTQFQVPYVFKTLFSKEKTEFSDFCEAKNVSSDSALYLDFNEKFGAEEHNYKFVGKTGLFCPVKPGFDGGLLMRCKDDKYYAATGTKGFRWKESEIVKSGDWKKEIDMSYYTKLVDEAVDEIKKYGDFEWFTS